MWMCLYECVGRGGQVGSGFCFHRDVGGCGGWGLTGCVCRCVLSLLYCSLGLVVLFVRGC